MTDATLSSLPAGKYSLSVERNVAKLAAADFGQFKVEQNVYRGVNFCCAFVALLLVPFFGFCENGALSIALERKYVRFDFVGF